MGSAKELCKTVRQALGAVADPRRAPDMQRYMKSAMPFLGVSTPHRRKLTRVLWDEQPPDDALMWRTQVAALWANAEFREERYAALDWCRYAWAGDRKLGRERFGFHTMDALPLFEQLIVDGSWWDFVDEISAHQIGVLLRKFPSGMKPVLRTWARCDHLWKRRSAIICQLDLKDQTDTALLLDCITPSLEQKPFAREFFIQKGIGWALRQYARTNPAWVRSVLEKYWEELPVLSRREASKHLQPKTSNNQPPSSRE